MAIEVGTLLNGRYRIVETLGQGGMGAVYRATDENLDHDVAVKENLFLSDEFSRQFRQEAVILARLRHPILPRVSDYFIIPGQGQYMVMDFIEGEDLRKRMEREGYLADDEVILIGIALCEGLAYLHSRKLPIIHRDIKPGNVKITPTGQVMLVDFGLAKEMDDRQNTSTGARAMTPGYSPPEQYGTAHTDARSDIYSLSATLYAALTGVIPEDGLARATGNADLTPIREIRPEVNPRLAAVLEKGLDIAPEGRYQSADELRQSLVQACSNPNRLRGPIRVPASIPTSDDEIPPETNPVEVASPALPAKRPSPGVFQRRKRIPYALLAVLVIGSSIVYLAGKSPAARDWFTAGLGGNQTATTTPSSLATATQDPAGNVLPTGTNTSPATPALSPTPEMTVTPVLSPTVTPVGGGVGQIAFVSNRTGGNPQIWRMDPNGGNLKQLTNVADGACQPSWSPDGKSIAFISPCQGSSELYPGASIFILQEDGQIVPIPPSPQGDFDPAWSPDGQRIVFTSLRDGRAQVYIYNILDHSVKNLSNSVFPDRQPSWNPGGSLISFIRMRPFGQLWIMTDLGKNQEQFSRSGELNNLWPAWSPDNQTIFFSQTTQGGGDATWLMELLYSDRGNGREFRIPATGQEVPGPVHRVSISPDGFWLVFESWPDGTNHDIYRMTISGASFQRLTSDRDTDFQPDWGPAPANP